MSRQEQDKYIVRLPDGMRDQLKAAAKANGRSLNAEIVHRLSSPTLQVISLEDAKRLLSDRGSTGGAAA